MQHSSPLHIGKLHRDEKIYQGVDLHGRFLFRQEITTHEQPVRIPLRNRSLVALGLTEVCCELGQGKVGEAGSRKHDY